MDIFCKKCKKVTLNSDICGICATSDAAININEVKKECMCGCGQLIVFNRRRKKFADYISGHNKQQNKYILNRKKKG